MLRTIVLAVLAVALLTVGPWLITTPAGPALVAVALAAQAPAPVPARVGLLTMSDRAFLAYLLTQEL